MEYEYEPVPYLTSVTTCAFPCCVAFSVKISSELMYYLKGTFLTERWQEFLREIAGEQFANHGPRVRPNLADENGSAESSLCSEYSRDKIPIHLCILMKSTVKRRA